MSLESFARSNQNPLFRILIRFDGEPDISLILMELAGKYRKVILRKSESREPTLSGKFAKDLVCHIFVATTIVSRFNQVIMLEDELLHTHLGKRKYQSLDVP